MTALRWVKPTIVVEVSFVEWTRDAPLRHPAFVGVRNDKLARQVRRELLFFVLVFFRNRFGDVV